MHLNREALRTIRERSGHSKTSLANLAGCDRTLIHRLENGQRNATPDIMMRLAAALNCPQTALMGPDEVSA